MAFKNMEGDFGGQWGKISRGEKRERDKILDKQPEETLGGKKKKREKPPLTPSKKLTLADDRGKKEKPAFNEPLPKSIEPELAEGWAKNLQQQAREAGSVEAVQNYYPGDPETQNYITRCAEHIFGKKETAGINPAEETPLAPVENLIPVEEEKSSPAHILDVPDFKKSPDPVEKLAPSAEKNSTPEQTPNVFDSEKKFQEFIKDREKKIREIFENKKIPAHITQRYIDIFLINANNETLENTDYKNMGYTDQDIVADAEKRVAYLKEHPADNKPRDGSDNNSEAQRPAAEEKPKSQNPPEALSKEEELRAREELFDVELKLERAEIELNRSANPEDRGIKRENVNKLKQRKAELMSKLGIKESTPPIVDLKPAETAILSSAEPAPTPDSETPKEISPEEKTLREEIEKKERRLGIVTTNLADLETQLTETKGRHKDEKIKSIRDRIKRLKSEEEKLLKELDALEKELAEVVLKVAPSGTNPETAPAPETPGEKKKSWWEKTKNILNNKENWKKTKEILNNDEIGNQTAKTGIGSVASVVGIKSIYDVPEYFRERFKVRGIFGHGKGLGGSMEELMTASQQMHGRTIGRTEAEAKGKQAEKHSEVREAIKDLNSRLKLTKEGNKKGSKQRNLIAKMLWENRQKEAMLKEARHTEITKILDDYTTTKVTGIQAIRESLNSLLTYSGAFLLRGLSYGAFALIERGQRIEKEMKREGKQNEKVEELKRIFVDGVKETYQGAFLKGENTGKQKALSAIKSYGTIARFAGIAIGMEFSHGDYNFDKILDTLEGKNNWTEGAYNFYDNFERVYSAPGKLTHLAGNVAGGTGRFAGDQFHAVGNLIHGDKPGHLLAEHHETAQTGKGIIHNKPETSSPAHPRPISHETAQTGKGSVPATPESGLSKGSGSQKASEIIHQATDKAAIAGKFGLKAEDLKDMNGDGSIDNSDIAKIQSEKLGVVKTKESPEKFDMEIKEPLSRDTMESLKKNEELEITNKILKDGRVSEIELAILKTDLSKDLKSALLDNPNIKNNPDIFKGLNDIIGKDKITNIVQIQKGGSVSEALNKVMTRDAIIHVVNPYGEKILSGFDANLVHPGDTIIETEDGQIYAYKTSGIEMKEGQDLRTVYNKIETDLKSQEVPRRVQDVFNANRDEGGFLGRIDKNEAKAASEFWKQYGGRIDNLNQNQRANFYEHTNLHDPENVKNNLNMLEKKSEIPPKEMNQEEMKTPEEELLKKTPAEILDEKIKANADIQKQAKIFWQKGSEHGAVEAKPTDISHSEETTAEPQTPVEKAPIIPEEKITETPPIKPELKIFTGHENLDQKSYGKVINNINKKGLSIDQNNQIILRDSREISILKNDLEILKLKPEEAQMKLDRIREIMQTEKNTYGADVFNKDTKDFVNNYKIPETPGNTPAETEVPPSQKITLTPELKIESSELSNKLTDFNNNPTAKEGLASFKKIISEGIGGEKFKNIEIDEETNDIYRSLPAGYKTNGISNSDYQGISNDQKSILIYEALKIDQNSLADKMKTEFGGKDILDKNGELKKEFLDFSDKNKQAGHLRDEYNRKSGTIAEYKKLAKLLGVK